MKILILHSSSDLYGSSKIIFLAAKKLKNDGHDVVFVISNHGKFYDLLIENKFDVYIIRLGIIRKKYLNVFGLLNRLFYISSSILYLYFLHKKKKFDLVYCNTTAVLSGGLFSKIFSLKCIYHIHEIISPENSYKQKILGFIINKCSNLVITVSNAVSENWKSHISENKLVRIYNGIPTNNFENVRSNFHPDLQLDSNTILFAMIGRINHYKGHQYLLDIISILIKRKIKFHTVFVGDAFAGDEKILDDFVFRIKSSEFKNYVSYIGYHNEIQDILCSIDILLCPSIKPDPFPTVILEAMAAEKPVIATNHGGSLEIIENGISGFLIPHNNVKEAADIIEKIIADKQKLILVGLTAKKRLLNKFSLSSFEDNLISVISKI